MLLDSLHKMGSLFSMESEDWVYCLNLKKSFLSLTHEGAVLWEHNGNLVSQQHWKCIQSNTKSLPKKTVVTSTRLPDWQINTQLITRQYKQLRWGKNAQINHYLIKLWHHWFAHEYVNYHQHIHVDNSYQNKLEIKKVAKRYQYEYRVIRSKALQVWSIEIVSVCGNTMFN